MKNLLNAANEIYQQSLLKNKEQLNYLMERGITLESIKEFEIGFSDSFCLHELKKNHQEELKELGLLNEKSGERNWKRIMFPIRDCRGEICGFNGRTTDKNNDVKYLLSPESMGFSKTKTLYNLHRAKSFIRETKEVHLVEGVLDLIAYHQKGIYNVVATLGTALTKEHIEMLVQEGVEKFNFGYDGDYAGFKASIINARFLSAAMRENNPQYKAIENIKFVMFPEGKDPCGCLKSENLLTDLVNAPIDYYSYCRTKCELDTKYQKVFEKVKITEKVNEEIKEISPELIKHYLLQLDIVVVISEYVKLDKAGKNYKGLCPFHEEKTSSFMVSPDKQIYKCFGCGEGGNAIKFIANVENLSFKQAITFLKDKYQLQDYQPTKESIKSRLNHANKKLKNQSMKTDNLTFKRGVER